MQYANIYGCEKRSMTTNNPGLSTAECWSRGEMRARGRQWLGRDKGWVGQSVVGQRQWSGRADSGWEGQTMIGQGRSVCLHLFSSLSPESMLWMAIGPKAPFFLLHSPTHSHTTYPEVLLAFHRMLVYLGEYPWHH